MPQTVKVNRCPWLGRMVFFLGAGYKGESSFTDGCLSLGYPSPLPQPVTSEGRGLFPPPHLPGTPPLRNKGLPDRGQEPRGISISPKYCPASNSNGFKIPSLSPSALHSEAHGQQKNEEAKPQAVFEDVFTHENYAGNGVGDRVRGLRANEPANTFHSRS